MNKLKKFWDFLKIFITFLIISFFIYYFVNNREVFNAVFLVPPRTIILLITLFSIHFFLNGLFILKILGNFKFTISSLESFYISVFSSFANYFLPMQGGAVIRSVYLKNTLDFPYTLFISSLYGNYIIIFLVNAVFGLFSLLFFHINQISIPFPLIIFFNSLLIFMLLLIFVRIEINFEKKQNYQIIKKILNVIKKILKGWQIISKNSKLLLTLMIITVGNFFVMTIIYAFEFIALNIESSLAKLILYNCLSGVSLLISITPGSLGIREGIYYLTSDILGITNDQIMQLALLDRGITILTLFFWFISLSIWKFATRKSNDNPNL